MIMTVSRETLVAWTVVATVVGAAVTGCDAAKKATPSPSASSSSTSATSSAAAIPPVANSTDYTALLMKPNDIGGDFNAPNPPTLNPSDSTGVAQTFANPDNSRHIVDTILIFADSAAAAATIENTKAYYAGRVTGVWQPVDVGVGGTTISGTSPDKAQAITALVFAEGKAIVNMEFNSAANDPIDPAIAADIGRKQDAVVKSGLPG
jgi:hypothetical protein